MRTTVKTNEKERDQSLLSLPAKKLVHKAQESQYRGDSLARFQKNTESLIRVGRSKVVGDKIRKRAYRFRLL